ncbi:hypothetical protein H6F61_19325 [Cyanobacteria bacterium FACHB-472]|nr:hypothetical protein [Cyanobacteria bacterium FACHB-472]
MSNFIQTVKLFYSQKYTEVYDMGNRLDVKQIYASRRWDFHVRGLEKFDKEEGFLEEGGYNLNHYFNLESIHIYIRELGLGYGMSKYSKAMFSQLPKSFRESWGFYSENVGEADWGSVWAFGVTIEGQDTFAIRVTTDGSDGWLEVFDSQGGNLGAARTDGIRIAWQSVDWIRTHFPAYPPEIDPKSRIENK